MANPAAPVIILRESAPTVLVQEPRLVLNVVAEQGAKGEVGATGPAGAGAQVTVPCDGNVNGHRILGYDLAGVLRHASNTDITFIDSVLGLSLNAAVVPGLVTVATNMEVQHAGWNWIMGKPIYLGVSGNMTQIPPAFPAVFQIQVGFPTAPDKMWVENELAIEL